MIEIAAILTFVNLIILIVVLGRLSLKKVRQHYQEILVKEIKDIVVELNSITERNVTIIEDKIEQATTVIKRADGLLSHPLLQPEMTPSILRKHIRKKAEERDSSEENQRQIDLAVQEILNQGMENDAAQQEPNVTISSDETIQNEMVTPDQKAPSAFPDTDALVSHKHKEPTQPKLGTDVSSSPTDLVTEEPTFFVFPPEVLSLDITNASDQSEDSGEPVQPELLSDLNQTDSLFSSETISENTSKPDESSDATSDEHSVDEHVEQTTISNSPENSQIPLKAFATANQRSNVSNQAYVTTSIALSDKTAENPLPVEKKANEKQEGADQSSRAKARVKQMLQEGKTDAEILDVVPLSKGELALLRSLYGTKKQIG